MAVTATLRHSAYRKMLMKMVKEQRNEALRRQTMVTAQKEGDAEVAPDHNPRACFGADG